MTTIVQRFYWRFAFFFGGIPAYTSTPLHSGYVASERLWLQLPKKPRHIKNGLAIHERDARTLSEILQVISPYLTATAAKEQATTPTRAREVCRIQRGIEVHTK